MFWIVSTRVDIDMRFNNFEVAVYMRTCREKGWEHVKAPGHISSEVQP
jgi:predicted transcriptional regulator